MSVDAAFRATIRLRDVSKRFDAGAGSCTGAVSALRGASVEIRSSEVLIVAGPRGAGKTTLLLCAAGLLQIDKGEIGRIARDTLYVDLARSPLIHDWPSTGAVFIDSCDDAGVLNGLCLARAIDDGLARGCAVVLASRDAANCLSLVPAAATVSVLHLRLGQVVARHDPVGAVNRVAEGWR